MQDDTTPDRSPREARTAPPARRGDLCLFAVYCILYGGFVYLAAFRADLMAKPVVGGVNLAIAYGVGLILAAILFAGIAMATYRRPGAES